MQTIKFLICLALPFLMAAISGMAAEAGTRVVIYDGVSTNVTAPPANLSEKSDLWVTLEDLKRATGYVLKPQGVCREQLCFPIPKARKSAFLFKQDSGKRSATWFNLSECGRLLRQPAAYDAESSVWYFGPRADEQNGFIESLNAPDFTLPDMSGKKHSLSDFRGRKVLLLTWASW
jgi:hypothetical protein